MNLRKRNSGHIFTVAVVALLCLSSGIQAARADVVIEWNAIAAALPIPGALNLARVMATMHGAVHDALNAIEPRYETHRFNIDAPIGASHDAAVASAAHGVLTALVPTHTVVFDLALDASLAKVPKDQRKLDGISVGMTAAQAMLDWRAKGNANNKFQDEPSSGASGWQRIPLSKDAGAFAELGGITPFMLKTADLSPGDASPAPTGNQFLRDLDEVRSLGGRNSTSRTAQQTVVAIFWANNEVLLINAVARAVSQAKQLSMHENARLFALLHMAASDASIAVFDSSYEGKNWRPIDAIRAGYGEALADVNWEPLLTAAPNSEYRSRYCIVTGAAVQLLREYFGFDQIQFDYVSPGALGMKRHYESFWQIATEMEDARVWAGIQFRSIVERSTELGRMIGTRAIATYMRPL